MSRLRQQFIALNILEDQKEQEQKDLLDKWHLLRLIGSAITTSLSKDGAQSNYESFLKSLDKETKEAPVNQFAEFQQWKLMHPDWMEFELLPEEVQELINASS